MLRYKDGDQEELELKETSGGRVEGEVAAVVHTHTLIDLHTHTYTR